MIEGVLIEKDAENTRKELDTQIMNIKQTLDMVQKSMSTQESVIKEWDKKYSSILGGKKQESKQETNTSSGKGGVLA